jgi:hypothetical protein
MRMARNRHFLDQETLFFRNLGPRAPSVRGAFTLDLEATRPKIALQKKSAPEQEVPPGRKAN